MQTHYLKTVNPYFQDLWDGVKTFEISINDRDRDYKVGDELCLQEYDPETQTKSGRLILASVPYILQGEPYLPPKYVCMSIRILKKQG